ncbi:derlin-1.1-like isoform X1 [Typha angustifolia]|uniref:derlin-1.1-like isoform X1 n=1 Tax=Typha angustifolia TaxID=59011 RepID=UPI003C306567
MSSPEEYYRSLPPVSKAYGVLCLMTTTAYYFQLYDVKNIWLSYDLVLKRFQLWRLFTNFFFLAPFSTYFGIRFLMLARYGVLLENGPFKRRTGDFLWMIIFGALSITIISMLPMFRYYFLGPSLVFMILYVWSREVPNSLINIMGVVTIRGIYLPWVMLALDLIFNNPLKPDIMGVLAGHLYYFFAVLYPLSGGKNILKTPLWVYKLVAFWGEGAQMNSPVQQNQHAGVAFRGTSYRLNQ